MEVESLFKRGELTDQDIISPEMFVKTELKEDPLEEVQTILKNGPKMGEDEIIIKTEIKEEPLEEAQTFLKNMPEIECTLVGHDSSSTDEVDPGVPIDNIKIEFEESEYIEEKAVENDDENNYEKFHQALDIPEHDVKTESFDATSNDQTADMIETVGKSYVNNAAVTNYISSSSSAVFGPVYDHFMNSNSTSPVYCCYYCNFKGKSVKILKKHIHKKHNVCDEQSSTSYSIEKEVKLHKCSMCHFTALNQTVLNHHIKTHSGKKPFRCNMCSYRGGKKINLLKHKEIHNEQKLLTCDKCGFKAVSKSAWKNHMRDEHSNDRPFKCNVCNYGAKFKRLMVLHMKRHMGVKPYKCDVCDFRAVQRSDVRVHMRKHSGEKSYKCTICSYRTVRKAEVTKHMNNIHLVGRAPPQMLELF